MENIETACPICRKGVSVTPRLERRECGHWLMLAGERVVALNSTADEAPRRAAERLGIFFYGVGGNARPTPARAEPAVERNPAPVKA